MRHDGRMLDQRLYSAKTFCQREETHRFEKASSPSQIRIQFHGQQAGGALHDGLEIVQLIELEPLDQAEAVPQG